MSSAKLSDAEWQDLNRRIFTAHPELAGGWKAGQMLCKWCGMSHPGRSKDSPDFHWDMIEPHEIPPPDLREPATFVRVLTESKSGVHWSDNLKQWIGAVPKLETYHIDYGRGDTPHEALARTLDAMEPQT